MASIAVAVLAGAGFVGFGWWLGHPNPVVEVAAPEVKQPDGSLITAKAPNAKAKPKQMVPKGTKVERLSEITVQGATPPEIAACTPTKCPPVSIDTTLVRSADGSRRLIVSSPDGQVLRAVDVPVETAAPPPEPRKWAGGMSYDLEMKTSRAMGARVFDDLIVGGEVGQSRYTINGPTFIEKRIFALWRF